MSSSLTKRPATATVRAGAACSTSWTDISFERWKGRRMEPLIVSRDEWLVARKAHLAKEKELTRLRDKLSAERRELPWVKVTNSYVFDGPHGKETLADLFDG